MPSALRPVTTPDMPTHATDANAILPLGLKNRIAFSRSKISGPSKSKLRPTSTWPLAVAAPAAAKAVQPPDAALARHPVAPDEGAAILHGDRQFGGGAHRVRDRRRGDACQPQEDAPADQQQEQAQPAEQSHAPEPAHPLEAAAVSQKERVLGHHRQGDTNMRPKGLPERASSWYTFPSRVVLGAERGPGRCVAHRQC